MQVEIPRTPSLHVMVAPPKHLAYVLAHPKAWRLFALLEQGKLDRYEQVRKGLGMHPQTFLRLVRQLSAYDLVWVRVDSRAKRPRGGPFRSTWSSRRGAGPC